MTRGFSGAYDGAELNRLRVPRLNAGAGAGAGPGVDGAAVVPCEVGRLVVMRCWWLRKGT